MYNTFAAVAVRAQTKTWSSLLNELE